MEILNQYATIFGAISDEFRLRLLLYLYVNDERCVCHICEFFDMGQSSISYHLKILTDANIINKKQVAVWNYYSINKSNEIYSILIDIFKSVDKKEWVHSVSNQ
ncbi:ArsR/SmtB family transcription factor [Clostridium sp. Cult3]|jgi:ArsR family transcriptional regulator|uniref:ArsR/SmtB family transcription factor n=1 Tax=Clostridium sp. Cult3 TaxID=2079004 RepID=UPI001F0319B5|nr:metalloregulator ArsR/SmtB family transcription factor [Clostridium sp. Cult3]MCF6460878.1 transcriptional regulator [Clostridium sp. Cult3]